MCLLFCIIVKRELGTDVFTYGFEIEFYCRQPGVDMRDRDFERRVRDAFQEAGLSLWIPSGDNGGLDYERGNAVGAYTLKYDGPGIEITSPVLADLNAVREAADGFALAILKLREAGFTCETREGGGFHIHVGRAGGFTQADAPMLRNIGRRWCNFEPFFNLLIAPYRRGSGFGMAADNAPSQANLRDIWSRSEQDDMSFSDLSRVFSRNDRYRKLNFSSLFAHGTVEVRAPHATFSADHIFGMISYLSEFFTFAANATSLKRRAASRTYDTATLYQMVTRSMTPETKDWTLRRLRRANPNDAAIQAIAA